MSAERLARMRATLARRQPDLTVLLDEVHKPHNLAAILRSCDAVGALRAHAVWARDRIRVSRHASAGAGQWVPVTTHTDAVAGIRTLQADGFAVYAAHDGPGAVDFRSVDYTRPAAILLGSELRGPHRAALDAADGHVAVPMVGLAESLNVSVAAAIILFEAQRQRAAAGLYDHCRLPEAEFERRLFEWMQPRIARYCRRRGLAYPALDEDGDVVGLP